MNVIFIKAFPAIVRLLLILSAVFYFAEIYHFFLAARALRHDFDLVIVGHGQLGYIGLNHISLNFFFIFI
jgi:hypothetical protein